MTLRASTVSGGLTMRQLVALVGRPPRGFASRADARVSRAVALHFVSARANMLFGGSSYRSLTNPCVAYRAIDRHHVAEEGVSTCADARVARYMVRQRRFMQPIFAAERQRLDDLLGEIERNLPMADAFDLPEQKP